MAGGRLNSDGKEMNSRQAIEKKVAETSLNKAERHGGDYPCQGALRRVFDEAKENGNFPGTIATLVGYMTKSETSTEELSVARKALEETLISSTNYATAITELISAGDGNPIIRLVLSAHISAMVNSVGTASNLNSLAKSCDESTLREVIKAAADTRNPRLLDFVILASRRCSHPVGAWQAPKLATAENQGEINRFLIEETSKLDEKTRGRIIDAANREFGEKGLHPLSQDMTPATGNERLNGSGQLSAQVQPCIPPVIEAIKPPERQERTIESASFERTPDQNSLQYLSDAEVGNDSSAMFDMYFRLKRIPGSEPVLNKRKQKTEISMPEDKQEYGKTDDDSGSSMANGGLAGIISRSIDVHVRTPEAEADTNPVSKPVYGKGGGPSIQLKAKGDFDAIRENPGVRTPLNDGGKKPRASPRLEPAKHAEVRTKRIREQVPGPNRQRKTGTIKDLDTFRKMGRKKPKKQKTPDSVPSGVLQKKIVRNDRETKELRTRKRREKTDQNIKSLREDRKKEHGMAAKKHEHMPTNATASQNPRQTTRIINSKFLKSKVSKPRKDVPEKRVLSERPRAYESNHKSGTERKAPRIAGALARHKKRVKALEKKERKRKAKKIVLLLLKDKRMRKKPPRGKFTF